ncbi:TORMOZ EMBRYO DEFECTIVE-like protein [Drosera capensis]
MPSLSLKKSYRVAHTIQQFYTGGPIAVSPDGAFLACSCDDEIKIVDTSTAAIRATLEGHLATAIEFEPNGRKLFSAGHRTIRVWDLETGKCEREWKGHNGPVMAMSCHPSLGLLATAGSDRKVLVWNVDGRFCTHSFSGHKGVITCLTFHPDPDRLLLFSGSEDTTVRVWDLKKAKYEEKNDKKKNNVVLEKHLSAVTSLALSEDGRILLTAGRDKVVNLWDPYVEENHWRKTILTYEVLETVCVLYSGTTLHSCLSSDKGGMNKTTSEEVYFLTVGERGIIRIWNSKSAVCMFEQKTSDVTFSSEDDDLRRGFVAASMLPADQGLLCVTVDQQILFFTPQKESEEDFNLNLSKRLLGNNEEVSDMKFLDEDEKFLAVATNIEQVRVYDLSSMSCSYVLAGHSQIVLCLDTLTQSDGSTLIVTGSKDTTVRVWDSVSTRCVGIGKAHQEAVGAVAFSKKKGKFFVSGSRDRTLKVWSIEGISLDSQLVKKLETKALVLAHDKDINSLAVAPNDAYVCSGSQDRTACVWRLPELVLVVKLVGHKRGIWSVEFSCFDLCVITASADKTIRLWSIADGSCLKTFEGHTASVLRASFISRGTQFVSCGADGLLKLWTIKTNECIATYDKHEDKVWALAIGQKTEMLATGGSDARINLWHDNTAAEKEEAFQKKEENFLKVQELENAVLDADYTKAIKIAFELRRSQKLLELLSEIHRKKEAEDLLRDFLAALSKEELRQLLEYVREWNTTKLCLVAQFVLKQIFSFFSPTEIVEVKGIGEILEGLKSHTVRLWNKFVRLEENTNLLGYTLAGMSMLEPDVDDRDAKRPRREIAC